MVIELDQLLLLEPRQDTSESVRGRRRRGDRQDVLHTHPRAGDRHEKKLGKVCDLRELLAAVWSVEGHGRQQPVVVYVVSGEGAQQTGYTANPRNHACLQDTHRQEAPSPPSTRAGSA
jgi:hypothetical protein